MPSRTTLFGIFWYRVYSTLFIETQDNACRLERIGTVRNPVSHLGVDKIWKLPSLKLLLFSLETK